MEQFIAVCREGDRWSSPTTIASGWTSPASWWSAGVDEEKVMYGVTTGFGALCTKAISKEETAKLQETSSCPTPSPWASP